MNEMLVATVELLGNRVAVTPVLPDANYQYVYRAALGVEWNNEQGRFFTPSNYTLDSRKDLGALENAGYLVRALREEMGLHLKCTEQTVWIGFDDAMRGEMQRLFDAGWP